MTFLAQRLQRLRARLGLSLDEIGAQGFVTATGWSRLENGNRQPSDQLIERLCLWLSAHKMLSRTWTAALQEELLLLKYLADKSAFVRAMAGAEARTTIWGRKLLASVYGPLPAKAKRSRRRSNGKAGSA